jgi:hypothetical protein
MQTTPITQADVARWKQIYEEYKPRLKPNRISGALLYAYLEAHYPLHPLEDTRAEWVVTQNILQNECLARQLPEGTAPEPVCCVIEPVGNGEALYSAQDAVFEGIEIIVGIDLVSGYFLVEGSSALWDELYAHRGLNEDDLENFYSVAEYISCLTRFGLLGQMLNG